MTELRLNSHPSWTVRCMIAAFRGWNDGGQGASLAGAYLARAWAGEEFASIDPENFYDFQATRPMVSLVDGYTRRIDWPENTFMHAPLPGAERDAIILLGVEPNLRWRTFSESITGIAKDFKRRARDHARIAARRRAAYAARRPSPGARPIPT